MVDGRSRETGATSVAGIAMILIGVSAFALAGFGVTAVGATQPNPEHKITLCHRTDSYTNPYVPESVDVASALFEGHDGHNGPVFYAAIPKGTKWGDIIPAFDFGPGEVYGGKNLTDGSAILDNGCNLPGTTTTTTTTTQPGETTTTTTEPEETTTTTSTTLPEETTTSVTQAGGTTNGATTVPVGSLGTPSDPSTPGGTNGPAERGTLPFTGSPILMLLGVGAAFLASGIGLIVRRRQWAR